MSNIWYYKDDDGGRCKCIKVECFENDNNSSIYEE